MSAALSIKLWQVDPYLTELLRDVLSDLGLTVDGPPSGPTLVLVQLDDPAGLGRIAEARGVFGPDANVVGLIPFHRPELAARARSLGTVGCYTLGSPLAELKTLLRVAESR